VTATVHDDLALHAVDPLKRDDDVAILRIDRVKASPAPPRVTDFHRRGIARSRPSSRDAVIP
jgi:hypothetical protein